MGEGQGRQILIHSLPKEVYVKTKGDRAKWCVSIFLRDLLHHLTLCLAVDSCWSMFFCLLMSLSHFTYMEHVCTLARCLDKSMLRKELVVYRVYDTTGLFWFSL